MEMAKGFSNRCEAESAACIKILCCFELSITRIAHNLDNEIWVQQVAGSYAIPLNIPRDR